MASYNITDLVKNAQKKAPLPRNFNDLDEQTKRVLRRKADAQGITVENLYAGILAQAEQDAAEEGNGFDPAAIAKAARR